MPLILGLAAGFFSSTPVGPISLAVISSGMRRGFRPALMTGLGSIGPNLLYAVIAMGGLSVINAADLAMPLRALGAAALLGFGIYDLREARLNFHIEPKSGQDNGAARGALLCLTNPFCVVFWLAALGLLRSHGLLSPGPWSGLLFLAGVLCGDVLWFLLIARLSAALRGKSDLGVLRTINTGISLLFIGIAVYWFLDVIRYVRVGS